MNDDGLSEDDRALSALIDGALSPDEAERLTRRLAEDPALARRLEELRAVDATLRAAYGPVASEPLPVRTAARLRPREVVVPARPRGGRLRAAVLVGASLAAGFLIAVLVLPRREGAFPPGLLGEGGAVARDSALQRVLGEAPSGESREVGDAWTATPRLTFRSGEGSPCRKVELASAGRRLEVLACRREGAWRVELVGFAAPPGGDASVYRPAAGTRSRVDLAIERMIDGAPLGLAEEREAIARGWEEIP